MPRHASLVVVVVVVVVSAMACGPSVAVGDGGAGDTSHGTSTGAADGTSAAESAASTTTTAEPGTSESGATESFVCANEDPNACPDECYRGVARQVIDDACGTIGVDICLPGGPKPGLPLTTYWAQTESGPVFAEYGGPCSVAARPDAWRECSGAADEPPECACFCQNGYCLGDEDRRALDACALEQPCDSVWVEPPFGAADHDAERCVLEGLAARIPGVYEVVTSYGFSASATRWYVQGGDEVARIERFTDDFATCPEVSAWSGALQCTLAAESYFAGCLEPQDEGEDCVLDVVAWVEGCGGEAVGCE